MEFIGAKSSDILLKKDVIFHSHEDYLRFDPDLDFPLNDRVSIRFKNPNMSNMMNVRIERGKNEYQFNWTTDLVFKQCRENSIPVSVRVYKNCRPPLKHYVYDQSDGDKLVAESDGYLEGDWACPYPLKDGHTYRF